MMAEEKKKMKAMHIGIAAVLAVAIVLGLVYMATNSNAAAPVVAVGDKISVYYTGTFQNGTVFDSNFGKKPLNFTVGSGELIKGFDQGVVGMQLNQTKNITVTPEEGYGLVNQSLIVVVPISVFGNRSVSIGTAVTAPSGQSGIVTAVNATNATVDFNPPLAGKTLLFEIKVVAIQKP